MSTATLRPAERASSAPAPAPSRSRAFTWSQVVQALPGAVRKLNPAALWRNPVMFLVWVGAALTTAIALAEPFLGGPGDSAGTPVPAGFTPGIAVWLWLTVLFANLAESVAEGRGIRHCVVGIHAIGDRARARLAQARRLRLAAPLGDRLGEIREQHREPEPHRDANREPDGERCAGGIAWNS